MVIILKRYQAIILLISLTVFGCQKQPSPLVKRQFLMDTVITIKSYDNDDLGQKTKEAALKGAFSKIKSVERRLNVFDEHSETAKINRRAGSLKATTVSTEMWDTIFTSKQVWELTDNNFDPTIGPLTSLWQFDKGSRLPKKSEINEKTKLVGFEKIVFNRQMRSVRLAEENMRLDFGGIAKGVAIDDAAKELSRRGLKSFLVTSVSSTKAEGSKPQNRPWLIGIQSPRPKKTPGLLGIIELRRGSISTTGDYQQFFTENGRRYSHILNPKSGFPANNFMSVTIVTKRSAAFADALSTGIAGLPPREAQDLVERLPRVDAVLVDTRGKIWISSNLRGKVRDLVSRVEY